MPVRVMADEQRASEIRGGLLLRAGAALDEWARARGWMFHDPVGTVCRAVGFAAAQAVSACATDPKLSFGASRLQLRMLRREFPVEERPVPALAQDAARARDILKTIEVVFRPGHASVRRELIQIISEALFSCGPTGGPTGGPGESLRQAACDSLARILWAVLECRSPELLLSAAGTLVGVTGDLARRPAGIGRDAADAAKEDAPPAPEAESAQGEREAPFPVPQAPGRGASGEPPSHPPAPP